MNWLDEDSQSRAHFERAKNVLAGGTTRDAVWMSPYPPYIARGEGAYVYDVDGNQYLDLTNNLGVLIHGHGHPAVARAAHEQIDKGVCFALPTPAEIPLAELLCERVSNFEKVRFINTGSEAVTIALKAARAYTGRPKIAKMEGVYHGSYDYAEISNYSSPDNWGNDPAAVATVKGTPRGIIDDVVVIPANDSAAAERILRDHAKDLAAVLVDPVPPRAGLVPLDADYVTMLRTLTRELGALLVYDEVIALRFAYNGSQGRFGGDPDLTALGKIIGGGYPVGAVAGKSEYMQVFEKDAGSSGTFSGNPLTMVAGHASMTALDQDAYDALDTVGDEVRSQIQRIIEQRGAPMHTVGTGSMLSIHPHQRTIRNYRDYFRSPQEHELATRIHRGLLNEGILVATTCACFLSTVLTPSDLDRLYSGFDKVLAEVMA